MSILDTYYSLTVATTDPASTGAYYSLTPDPNLTISQGGATLSPSAPSQQMISVSVYPQTLQVNAAAGAVNAGANIVTNANEIAGRLLISPPVDVSVAVTLYGKGGAKLGQAIADPGSGGVPFAFPVSAGDGIPANDAPGVLQKLLEKR